MSRFIDEANRLQGALLPKTIDEYVCEENPVRVIDAFVGTLDLAALGFEGVEPEATGRPAYPARTARAYKSVLSYCRPESLNRAPIVLKR